LGIYKRFGRAGTEDHAGRRHKENDLKDLTILFITGNKVPESWAEYHREVLLEAVGDTPIITLSKKPTPIGLNVVQEEGEFSYISNPDFPDPHLVDNTGVYSGFYAQLFKGAKLAITPYIAIVEDDTLYHSSHFEFRPPMDAFAYNLARWSLYTWGPPVYSYIGSRMGCAGIYPRELAVETLEERFTKFRGRIPFEYFGELGCYEKYMGLKRHTTVTYYSEMPIIQFNHDYFSTIPNTPELVARRHRKRMGFLRALSVPFWGASSELVKEFK
jgi:hypothetical protein